MDRPQKITFGEMRGCGVVVYCRDFKCSHSAAMSAEQWPEDLRLSDSEDRWARRVAMCGPTSIGIGDRRERWAIAERPAWESL